MSIGRQFALHAKSCRFSRSPPLVIHGDHFIYLFGGVTLLSAIMVIGETRYIQFCSLS